MEHRNLKIAKDILLNIFWIGYGLLILSWLIYIPLKPFWMNLIKAWWHINNPDFMDTITIAFFALAKFTLFFYALVPALAICWTLRKLGKKSL